MSLSALLTEKRAAILERWTEFLLGSYPPDTVVFLRKQRDRFANPVGHAIQKGLAGMLDGLLAGAETESLRPFLDDILRIRAVQQFGPARSLGFVFQLKDAVRAELGAPTLEPEVAKGLLELERRVDALALLGFEVYLGCREQIYELRLTEIKNRTIDVKEKLLRQRGKWTGPPAEELLLFPDGAPGQPAPLVALLETGAAPSGQGERPASGAQDGDDASNHKPTAE